MVTDGAPRGQFVDDDAVELVVLGMLGAVALEPLDDLGLRQRAGVDSVDGHREHAHPADRV